MAEAKRRRAFATRVLTDVEVQHYTAAARQRLASGRPGFRPDLGQALHAIGQGAQAVMVVGFRFIGMAEQAGRTEVNGITRAHFETPEGANYMVTVSTEQSPSELLDMLARASDPIQVVITGVLDHETITGDSGEVFRRILGEVKIVVDDGGEPARAE